MSSLSNNDTDNNGTNTDTELIHDYYGDDYYDTSGNATVIKENRIIYDTEEMQFIAVTTKDGHVFYILIDYTAIEAAENGEDGASAEETVYFLNKVDDYDLYALLYSSDSDSYTSSNSSADTEIDTENDTDTETQNEEADDSNSSMIKLVIGGVLIAMVVVLYFIFKGKGGSGKKGNSDSGFGGQTNDDDDIEFDNMINEDEEGAPI